jgi:hypothetical protein
VQNGANWLLNWVAQAMQPGTAFHTGLPSWLQALARSAELVRLFELMRYFRILFGGLAFKVLDRFFFQDRFSSKRLSAFLTNAIIFFTFSSLFLIAFCSSANGMSFR